MDTKAYVDSQPARWDIVTYLSDRKSISCSRIVGLPGEILNLDEKGLTINEILSQNPGGLKSLYKRPKLFSETEIKAYKILQVKFPYVIPAGFFFLIGDNVEHSRDSRYIGAIARSQIRGKIVKIL